MHEYYDPNDYMGGIHQEMDRDELELEVLNLSNSFISMCLPLKVFELYKEKRFFKVGICDNIVH